MSNIFQYLTDTIGASVEKFNFLKKIKIIKAESEAVGRDSMFLLERNSEEFDIIITDDAGNKRKNKSNTFSLPAPPSTSGIFVLKSIDGLIQWVLE